MITVTEARRLITSRIVPLNAVQVPLAAALGRVLARDVHAVEEYPSSDRSMMDGYAIISGDSSARFRIVDEIQPGVVSVRPISAGECVRIFTGASLPLGASQVIPQEDVVREGEFIRIAQRPALSFVRCQGAEAKAGDVLLRAGSRLKPTDLAILAQIGEVSPSVFRSPTVVHIATGNELVPPDQTPAPGQIRDSNSTLIAALLADLGITDLQQRQCGDEPLKLRAMADAPCDLLLISGGASVGDHDHGAAVLRELGFTMRFDRVNLRPGKPLSFATRPRNDGRQSAFVLPGNPVSHFVCFHLAVRLAIEAMIGFREQRDFVTLPLSRDDAELRANPRETFWPAKLVVKEGQLAVRPLKWSSSGDTFSLAGCDALIRIEGGQEPGVTVPTVLL